VQIWLLPNTKRITLLLVGKVSRKRCLCANFALWNSDIFFNNKTRLYDVINLAIALLAALMPEQTNSTLYTTFWWIFATFQLIVLAFSSFETFFNIFGVVALDDLHAFSLPRYSLQISTRKSLCVLKNSECFMDVLKNDRVHTIKRFFTSGLD